MNKISNFITYMLKIFVGIAIVAIFTGGLNCLSKLQLDSFSIKLTYLISFSIILGMVIIFLKIDTKIKIFLLLTIAFIIRLWWIFTVKSIPVSDFDTIYRAAKSLLEGDKSALFDLGYLARFPHLVMTMLYMAGVIAIFPIHNIIVIKLGNVIFSVLSVYLIYRLSKEFVKNKKIQLVTLLLGAIFPPFIAYSSVFCTENIAIPLYIITIIFFIKLIDYRGKSLIKTALLCGILLGVANLFRAVGIVFIVVFIFFIIVYKKKEKISAGVFLVTGFLLITILTSGILILNGIIQSPLWAGKETSFSLLLKGSNIENGGRWNLEDAHYIDSHLQDEDLAKQCINIALERFQSLSLIDGVKFFQGKFMSQWQVGDGSGTYWAFLNIEKLYSGVVPIPFEIVYLLMTVLVFISLFAKENDTKNSVIYITLCVLGLMFMIIETQSRYSYIISWVFIVLAVQGIEFIVKFIERKIGENAVTQVNS